MSYSKIKEIAPIFAFIAIGLASMASTATAQSVRTYCNTHDKIVEQLSFKHQETRAAMGLSIDGSRLIELFQAGNGNWTLLVSDSQGKTCVLGAGKSWVNLPPKTQS